MKHSFMTTEVWSLRCISEVSLNNEGERKVIWGGAYHSTVLANLAELRSLNTPFVEVTSKRNFKERVHRLECRPIS